MIQYSIEGDIDFFKELQTIQTEKLEIEDDNKCMLSDEVLRPDAVTLVCGHKFNYKPLFAEVLMQKCSILPKNMSSTMTASYVHLTNNNNHNHIHNNSNNENTVVTLNYNSSMNMETMKLNYNEIKCPYCRTITSKLLPYYPYPDIKQIRYVNFPLNLCMQGVKCNYFESKSINKECDNAPTYDEKYGILCKTHMKCAMKPIHVKPAAGGGVAVKRSVAKKLNKVAVAGNENENENVIVYKTSVTTGCSYILIAGNRKGSACGCVAYTPVAQAMDDHNNTDNKVVLCKRHYNKG
jgi:hypothetical protein